MLDPHSAQIIKGGPYCGRRNMNSGWHSAVFIAVWLGKGVVALSRWRRFPLPPEEEVFHWIDCPVDLSLGSCFSLEISWPGMLLGVGKDYCLIYFALGVTRVHNPESLNKYLLNSFCTPHTVLNVVEAANFNYNISYTHEMTNHIEEPVYT